MCHFQILPCTFIQNQARLSPPEDSLNDHYYGGSAIYLHVNKFKVKKGKFNRNVGPSSKICNNFEKSSSLSLKEDCFFETGKESSSSIFYVHESRHEVPSEIRNCIFSGDLSKDAFHIDGTSLNGNKEKTKFRIISCKFSSDIEKSVNLKKSPLILSS